MRSTSPSVAASMPNPEVPSDAVEHAELWLGVVPPSSAASVNLDAASSAQVAPPHDLPDFEDLVRVRTVDVRLEPGARSASVETAVDDILARLPALAAMTLTSGDFPAPDASAVVALHQCARRRGIAFAMDFVLDAGADAFALPRVASVDGKPSWLETVLSASRSLRAENVPVRWLIPLEREVVYRLEALFSLARDEGVEPVLAPHWIARQSQDRARYMLDDEERLFVRDFLMYRLLDEEQSLHGARRTHWYRMLNDALAENGNLEAAGRYRVAVLAATGSAPALTWTTRRELRASLDGTAEEFRAPRVRESADTAAHQRVAQVADIASVLTHGALAALQRARAWVADALTGRRDAATGFRTVLLIGAYGGDHIGDTAILGGVLFRLNGRYGTTRAILLSQRPDHTRHLVPMLDTPVPVEVDAYELATIRARLPQVDAVVFAGGPLIDLPKQLVRHLYAVSLARRMGKPFVMEGIGPGPFPRWPSEWTARRLVRLAQRISLRTSADAGSPLMEGLAPEIGRDPAFDYLATRGTPLTRLRAQDQQWIEHLLPGAAADGQRRPLIGINLRPIRHLFTVGGPAGKRAEYTRAIEAQCERNLAEAMHRFHRASPEPPCFVFFPMNAIQFGMSDLRSAYRLQRELHPDVDFRVWQADAGLDGVVALLRRLDIVITMRFHATIFALAQQRRVIGIDYRIGKRDKVGDLLADFGLSENCRRIDELTADWLCGRLEVLIAAQEARP